MQDYTGIYLNEVAGAVTAPTSKFLVLKGDKNIFFGGGERESKCVQSPQKFDIYL